MINLLNGIRNFSLLEGGYEIGLDWLGRFARVIIEGVGDIGFGIILFTLVLKAITLPFDIYQRVKMRKQNLIMKQMQPELEKLQKQYANDKTTYNQKMLELQKKNGYSVFGACLPLIISLVILIVAFQGFRTYSQYANLKTFKDMSEAYNAAVLEKSADGRDYLLSSAEDESTVLTWTDENGEPQSEPFGFESGATLSDKGIDTGDGLTYRMATDGSSRYLEVTSPGKPLGYRYNLDLSDVQRQYFIDTEILLSDASVREAVQKIMDERNGDEDPANDYTSIEQACDDYLIGIGADAAAEVFRSHPPKFIWVRNVWYPDVSYNHPIPSYSTFSSQLSEKVTFPEELDANGKPVKKELSTVLREADYNRLTRSLAAEKKQPNGYFILIILSIGFMVLSQFITMRSSKETNKYQTVDGQGAATQKAMLFIMPVIYAVFAFLYSAAFSIYMTMSSVVSLLVTVIANLILDKVFKKKEEEAFKAEHTQVLPWMKDGKDKEKPNKKDKKRK